jgi:hypothetical protein
VTVLSVQIVTIKVGHKKVKEIVIDFSGPLDSGSADSLGNYQLTSAGRGNKFGAKGSKPVALASASYNSASDSVTLIARGKLVLSKPLQLRVSGSALEDARGRPIDGNGDGQPGGDALAMLTARGATVTSAVPAWKTVLLSVQVVDDLLAAGEWLAATTDLEPVARALHDTPGASRKRRP